MNMATCREDDNSTPYLCQCDVCQDTRLAQQIVRSETGPNNRAAPAAAGKCGGTMLHTQQMLSDNLLEA